MSADKGRIHKILDRDGGERRGVLPWAFDFPPALVLPGGPIGVLCSSFDFAVEEFKSYVARGGRYDPS